jgi:thiol-disulfide isomerase/thioredoxin
VAGEAWISREIKLSDNMTTYTHTTPIDITPEEATHVTIGGTGRPVVGKVRLPESAPKKINWAYVQAHVSTKTPKLEPPADLKDKGQEALQAWYAEWSKSDEAKAQRKARRSFSFKINDDGTFRIEDVPAGTYQLNVTLNEPPPPNQCGFGEPIGSAAKEFTVEAMETGRSDEPQDLGALDVEMYKHLNVGDAAPAFEVPTLDDRTLKLADLRGKYVLLDFWATWCGPCRGETPHLKSVYEKFGKDPRFVIVSLSLDPEQKEPREYAKKEGMDWPQGFLGDWSKTKLPNEYGVRGIPAIFLIGPDGKILAKDLRGPAILSAVEKALSSVGPGAATSQPPAAAMRHVD